MPEAKPPLLGDWFIYLSVIVLFCGIIAITALEFGGEPDLRAPLVRIPFAIHVPGVKGGVRRDPVSLVDLAPTILSLLGAPDAMPDLDGIDLDNDVAHVYLDGSHIQQSNQQNVFMLNDSQLELPLPRPYPHALEPTR